MATDSPAAPVGMSLDIDFESIRELCRKRPVFAYSWGCGRDAGFGANYSGMIKALTLCLLKGVGYGFVSLKKPRGIAISHGYRDFFEPFCLEVDGCFLDSLNTSPLPFQAKLPILRPLVGLGLRLTTKPRADYFVFSDLASVRSRLVPEDDPLYTVDFQKLRSRVARSLWRLNPEIRECVGQVKAECGIGLSPYISTVVRRGDKCLETSYVSIDHYVAKISAFSGQFSRVFISGDDVPAIDALARRLPNFTVFTIRPPFAGGYVHSEFLDSPPSSRLASMVRFLAQVELMAASRLFLGTRSTNVSYMVRDLIGDEQTVWVD